MFLILWVQNWSDPKCKKTRFLYFRGSAFGARKHVFLCHKNTCLLVTQENIFSCDTRRHVLLSHKKTCLLVPQQEPTNSKKHHFYTMSDRLLPDLFGEPFQKTVPFLYHVFLDPLISLLYNFGELRPKGDSAIINQMSRSAVWDLPSMRRGSG